MDGRRLTQIGPSEGSEGISVPQQSVPQQADLGADTRSVQQRKGVMRAARNLLGGALTGAAVLSCAAPEDTPAQEDPMAFEQNEQQTDKGIFMPFMFGDQDFKVAVMFPGKKSIKFEVAAAENPTNKKEFHLEANMDDFTSHLDSLPAPTQVGINIKAFDAETGEEIFIGFSPFPKGVDALQGANFQPACTDEQCADFESM